MVSCWIYNTGEQRLYYFIIIIIIIIIIIGVRGSVVDWGTILQAGRSRIRFPMKSFDFLVYLTLPAAL
jgi:hypothetical protein